MQHGNKKKNNLFFIIPCLAHAMRHACFNFILSYAKPHVLVYLPTDHSNLKKTD